MLLSARKALTTLCLLAAAIQIPTALAATETLNIQWNGAQYGNNATATGTITFDNAKLPQTGTTGFVSLPAIGVTSISITITGALSGNGTFNLSDFYGLSFTTPSSLNLSAQLIGQKLSNGVSFGTLVNNGSAGDFNLFGQTANAPTGSANFTLTTNQGSGSVMSIVAMTPATQAVSTTPVPTLPNLAFWFLGLALLGIGYHQKGVVSN